MSECNYEKIDSCVNDCMLFYKEHESETYCSVCGVSRYKLNRTRNGAKRKKDIARKEVHYMPLIPRMLRLYTSKSTSKAMRWHKESPRKEGVLVHPSDGEAWKHFDATYPDFAAEVRNVRLGICSDTFNSYGRGSISYSCWSVIVKIYNLPPWLCLDDRYMFCTLFMRGPKSPGRNLDVYIRPLMDELKQLWTHGVQTWDAFKKQNFNMRAAVMWTVNDSRAYEMLSGWSMHGKLACPYCMDDTKSFYLSYSKKPCWFDCHRRFLPKDHPFRKQKYAFTKNREEHDEPPPHKSGEDIFREVSTLPDNRWGKKFMKDKGYRLRHKWTKKSIFWELPYWKTNLIRHNLDVMHIEKHVFENIFNTVMDFKWTTSKDTARGCMDLKEICRRPELELKEIDGKIVKPVAGYVLTKNQKELILEWLSNLKLPDGYAADVGDCVNLEQRNIEGLKSHDCHVLLDRLLPIALRYLLPDNIWIALTELSEFFRALTSATLCIEDLKKMEESIVVILCKLERIFPPSFFDSMEHLAVHLAYEARVGGPVQYRWMYPFKRFLGAMKTKLRNKANDEASISHAVVIDEVVSSLATNFPSHVGTRLTTVGYNYDSRGSESDRRLSVFSSTGQFLGTPICKRMLSLKEVEAATLFVLINCPEVDNYLDMFEEEAGQNISREQLDIKIDKEFPSWLKKYISDHPEDAKVQMLKPLTQDPYLDVNLYNGYFVGGYEFHTKDYGETRSTWKMWKSYVNLKGNIGFYGVLKEVIELRYLGGNNVVLFNCEWRDPARGIRKHDKFDLVDVLESSKYMGVDTFILASQAQQVCMTPYPHRGAESNGWWAVWKTMARSVFDIQYQSTTLQECYQEDEMPVLPNVSLNEHLSDAAMVHDIRQFEHVLPIELPPRPAYPGQLVCIEADYSSSVSKNEDEGEDEDEYDGQDELEFDNDCSSRN